MVEVKLSKRAEQVLSLIPRPLLHQVEKGAGGEGFVLRQATLAQQLGCSRWTIGRAIKKLKEAGLLLETGRDKQSRCKTYALQAPSPLVERGRGEVSDTGPRLGGRGDKVRGEVFVHDKIPPAPLLQRGEIRAGFSVWGEILWERYRKTYAIIFTQPDLKERFAQVSWRYESIDNESELYSLMFAGLAESYGMPWA